MLGEREILDRARRLDPNLKEDFGDKVQSRITQILNNHCSQVYPHLKEIHRLYNNLKFDDPSLGRFRRDVELAVNRIGIRSFNYSFLNERDLALIFTNAHGLESRGDEIVPMEVGIARIDSIFTENIGVSAVSLAFVNHGEVEMKLPTNREPWIKYFDIDFPVFVRIGD